MRLVHPNKYMMNILTLSSILNLYLLPLSQPAPSLSLRGNNDVHLDASGQNETVSRKLEWKFVEQTIDNDEWYTYYDSDEIPEGLVNGKSDTDDFLRYTDICPNTETKTYSYANCLKIKPPDCLTVRDRQDKKEQWGEAKLCINRAPFSKKNTTLFYVSAMKCIPSWENCDKCQCGIIDSDSSLYGRCYITPEKKNQNPQDDRWDDNFCDKLDKIKVQPGTSSKMEFSPFDGTIITPERTVQAKKNDPCPIGEIGCELPATDGRITMPCDSCETGKCGYSTKKLTWTCKSKSWPYAGEVLPADDTLEQGMECPIGTSGCEYPEEAGLQPTNCKACKTGICGYKGGDWKCRSECWPDCNGKNKPPQEVDIENPDNEDSTDIGFPADPDFVIDGSLEKGDSCPIACEKPDPQGKVMVECGACASGYCGYSNKKGWICRSECWPNCKG